ncbi:MAG: alpha/beta hydrolase-fold protein [Bacteroidota bacterium]
MYTFVNGQSLDTTFQMYSKTLSEYRTIKVGLPSNYFNSTESFNSIYTFDAEYKFDIHRASQKYLEISTRIPNSILIGINNISRETRNRDLLPKNFEGHDSLFRDFVLLELIPYIDNHYRTDSIRTMAGHSHGGVFTVVTMIKRPEMFKNYIAIDAAFQIINTVLPDSLDASLNGKSLYYTTSDGLYGFNEEISADMLKHNFIFNYYLVQNPIASFKVYREHIADDHGNSFITGFHRGIRWVNSWPISLHTVRK